MNDKKPEMPLPEIFEPINGTKVVNDCGVRTVTEYSYEPDPSNIPFMYAIPREEALRLHALDEENKRLRRGEWTKEDIITASSEEILSRNQIVRMYEIVSKECVILRERLRKVEKASNIIIERFDQNAYCECGNLDIDSAVIKNLRTALKGNE